MKAKVLVLGPPAAGKKSLVRTIQSKCDPTGSAVGAVAAAGGSHAVTLKFDTKYYTAEVDVHVLGGTSFCTPSSDAVTGAEAVVVVLDSCSEPSIMEDLSKWNEVLEGAASTMLLVLSKRDVAGSDSGAEAFRAIAFEWSLDNGFELIDANCLDGEEGGEDPRDRSGVPRVIEALESTMWSSMSMKPRDTGAASAAVSQQRHVAVEKPAEEEKKAESFATPAATAASAGSVVADDAVGAAAATASAAFADDEEPHEGRVLDALLADARKAKEGEGAVPAQPEVDDAFDRMLDGMDALMQQIQNQRSRATGSSVSDSDRRENAAALALRLAMMLGINDDGEGGAGSEEDD